MPVSQKYALNPQTVGDNMVWQKLNTKERKQMSDNELIFDKLCEVLFPELDEAIDREAEHLMDEHNINHDLMIQIIEAFLYKRAKQVQQ